MKLLNTKVGDFMVNVRIDMTGWMMSEHGVPDSRLTVIKQTEDYVKPNGEHVAQWLCECSCPEHNKIIAIGYNIKNGDTKSCGCIAKESNRNNGKNLKKDTVWEPDIFEDKFGKYKIGYTSNTNKMFYIDLDDYEKVKNYCWSEQIDYTGYHCLRTWSNGKHIKITEIIGYPYYDHADRNPLNNRKYNLREATRFQQAWNKNMYKNNTSGIKGVSLNNKKTKWIAYIRYNNKRLHLGTYINKEEAIKTRLEAEAKYYGKFAPQRHLFEQYGIIENTDATDINIDQQTT